MVEHLVEGTLVKWNPPRKRLGKAVPLRPNHPGMVIPIGPRHILVNWVRRRHTRAEQSAYEPAWLTVIDRTEFDELAQQVHDVDIAEGEDRSLDERFPDLG